MIYSMTAFTRIQHQGEWGSLVCEMRSINHRYLEIGMHLPDVLRVLEMPMRDVIRKDLKRGKVECTIRYQAAIADGTLLSINTELAKELCRATQKIAGFLIESAPVNPADILHFQGVISTQEADIKRLQEEVFHVMNLAIKDLMLARAREGEELKSSFEERLDLIQAEVAKVRKRLPQVILDQQDRLNKRLAEAKLQLDAGRLEQEMLMFAQKIDVAEEVDRIEMHAAEVRRVLNEGGLAGRRLDFLLQELNREANTLGSKSTDTVLMHAAVEMKVLIEQVREQVQNIE